MPNSASLFSLRLTQLGFLIWDSSVDSSVSSDSGFSVEGGEP